MNDYVRAALNLALARAPGAHAKVMPYPYTHGDLCLCGASISDFGGEWRPVERGGHVYVSIPAFIVECALADWARLTTADAMPATVEGCLAARIISHEDGRGDVSFDDAERVIIRALMDGGRTARRAVSPLRAAFAERLRQRRSLCALAACAKRLLSLLSLLPQCKSRAPVNPFLSILSFP